MTRIVIDLPEKDLRQLDNLAAIRHLSRAELIGQALSGYLADNLAGSNNNVFGLWTNRTTDGILYENQIRREWK
ncbi:ribbon-helix-helix protein, CopG family [Acerihabitans sp. TG2]|uniref:ribbon-helix-helix domain-containing protein n=1 Tax=Acerihabitans sp. TG2 TaxID=3096008 RepID=UPI002B230A9A|nr:ribbon-helix-helix protein, CopG family [Acerihabitans sp. TG2]MEA9393396.1 ribbon-helix-helix protein, CopG family [Acerihabitans sp. TG2]